MSSGPADSGPMASSEGAGRRLAESTRVEAFSDGVFAIALTLLVLDLKTPGDARGHFAHALAEQWPAYLAYLAAFLNISAVWINHHDLFTRVRRVDAPLICANLLLLLVSSLFPWPAAVVSDAIRDGTHADQVVSCLLYAGVGFLVPVMWMVLYGYLARSPHLLNEGADVSYARDGIRRSSVSLVAFPVAAVVALFAPVLALAAFVLLPLFFVLTIVFPRSELSRG